MAIPEHLTPEQCGELARLAEPRMLVLTHLYPPVENVDIAQIVSEKYGGPVVVAHDGWRKEFQE
jgi:ribonuclease BN (tRNA processing enzyme)